MSYYEWIQGKACRCIEKSISKEVGAKMLLARVIKVKMIQFILRLKLQVQVL